MRAFTAARFFRIVSPLPPLMRPTFVVLVLVAAPIVVMDVERTRDVLAPILTLQLFAAASGFAGHARRGYYDLLLTSGGRRLSIALTHWVFSIAPGVVAWMVVALVEAALRRGYPDHALAGGTLAAMAIVSMLGWAFTVGLPRFSGAIGWVVVLVAAASLWPDGAIGFAFSGGAGRAAEIGTVASAWQAAAVLVNPALLLGRGLEGMAGWMVIPAIAAGVIGMVTACAWIASTDYPLEAAQ